MVVKGNLGPSEPVSSPLGYLSDFQPSEPAPDFPCLQGPFSLSNTVLDGLNFGGFSLSHGKEQNILEGPSQDVERPSVKYKEFSRSSTAFEEYQSEPPDPSNS